MSDTKNSKQVTLVAGGDLGVGANQIARPAQEEMDSLIKNSIR